MYKRGRIRPSKGSSIVSMIGGVIFIIIGFTVVIPRAGMFGMFWTLVALIITGSHAYNVFSEKGFSQYQVDVDETNFNEIKEEGFDDKLRKLKTLKDDGLISDEEYEIKRKEILKVKW